MQAYYLLINISYHNVRKTVKLKNSVWWKRETKSAEKIVWNLNSAVDSTLSL